MFYAEVINPVLECIRCFPHRNAFCINNIFYTYKQFGNDVSKIRHEIKLARCLNSKVGLVINDDIETYASIFALWLEGKSYVPLHPNWPLGRCEDICNQVEADLILDSSEITRYEKSLVIKTSSIVWREDDLIPKVGVSEDELAYILFTSGSTGKPKGVQITRRNVGAFMKSFWETGISVTEQDRCLQCFDLSFDVSVQGFMSALSKGACCFTVPYGKIKYLYVSSLIVDQKITFGAMAPSMLRYLKPYFDELDASSLKTCILTAEACPMELMEDWFRCAYNSEIYDFYGPTECTIYCTYYKLTRGARNKELNGFISIGKPLSHCVGIIIGDNGKELPVGEKGELCIAGDQISKGYWKNEEKNLNSFFIKDVNGVKMRFYHTGDLCYMDEDGDIMYSGRMDLQAKIQGFRVEMGEIEYHARVFLKGTNVVCLAFDNEEGLTEIAMFIEKEPFNPSELLTYMKTKMPLYMIPTKLYWVPTFLLNANDKIDKNILKKLIK